MSSKPQFKFRAQLTSHPGWFSYPPASFRQAVITWTSELRPPWSRPCCFCCWRSWNHPSGFRLEDRWTDGSTAHPSPTPPSPNTITNSPVKSTYIYELFINLPTLIYDPWLDPTLDSLRVFLSFFPSLLDFFLSVNVMVHILNIATRQELGGRQLGASPMTHGQERDAIYARGGGWWRKSLLVGSGTGWLLVQEKIPEGPAQLPGALGELSRKRRTGSRAV